MYLYIITHLDFSPSKQSIGSANTQFLMGSSGSMIKCSVSADVLQQTKSFFSKGE
jgi:hypothetical protein